MTKAIYVDLEKCDGCMDCIRACEESGGGVARLRVLDINGLFVPVSCHHCEAPDCMGACTRNAIEKTPRGEVIVKTEFCTGCGDCTIACPNGALTIINKKASKCDLCRGKEMPICVEACGKKAMVFGEMRDIVPKIREDWAIRILNGEKVSTNCYFMTNAKEEKKR